MFLFIHSQHDDIDLIANLHQFVGMINPPRPRHFTDMHETFDARFQFDERAIRHHVDNFALDPLVHRITTNCVIPGIGLHLLQPQGDLLFLAIDIQDHDFNFLFDRHHFRGMTNTFPAHVRNMQQSVNPTEINKRTEVGDVLDDALANLFQFQCFHQGFAVLLSLSFDQRPPADDDIPSRLINFEHLTLNFLPNKVANIIWPPNIDLTGWEKDVDANIHKQSALDLAGRQSLDHLTLLDLFHHLSPGQDLLGLTFTERNHPVGIFGLAEFVFQFLDQDLDSLPHSRGILMIVPFIDMNCPLTLESNINNRVLIIDPDNGPFDDVIDNEIRLGFETLVQLTRAVPHQGLKFLGQRVIFEIPNKVTVYHELSSRSPAREDTAGRRQAACRGYQRHH